MNTYSIGSDSPRWWWPSAAAGAVGSGVIAAILVLPAGSTPGGTTPADAPAPPRDPWFSKVDPIDPTVNRQCYALPARGTAWLDNPSCGRRQVVDPWSGSDVPRPGLDSRP